MLYVGSQGTAGNGTAVVTAAADRRLKIGKFIQLQLNAAGPQTVILKFGSTAKYSVTFQNAGDGIVLQNLPEQWSADGEALYVNVSASIAVGYVIDVEEIKA